MSEYTDKANSAPLSESEFFEALATIDWKAGETNYVCPQCGPAPEGADKHAERFHTWPPVEDG